MAAEEYFRARSADLRDLRDRVCRILTGAEELAPMPPGAILAAEDLMPSIFLEIDWRPRGALALTGGSASSHVAMLARARGVPMVIGLALGPPRPTDRPSSTVTPVASCSAPTRPRRASTGSGSGR